MTLKPTGNTSKAKANTIFKVTEPIGLLKFLILNVPGKSRNTVKSLLAHRQVWVGKQIETQFDFPLLAGNEVSVSAERPAEETRYRGLRILFEDSSVIVIEKEAGLLSIASAKDSIHTAYSILSNHVKRENPQNRIFIVHRLDRDTSGVMMFAKSEKVQTILQKDWQENVSERTYVAIVEGRVENDKETIRSFLKENKAMIVYSTMDSENGDEAITHYKVLKRKEQYSLLEVELETGRKNQIRVHMKDIGHSVVGDEKYGSKTDPLGRMGLHARVLAFKHPLTGKTCRFETAIPARFSRLMEG